MKKQTRAFTLVELIVVITILAILWTIAFITLQGYSAQARDSKRLSDIQNIKKSLELFSLNTWVYPSPDNWSNIEYDNELVWTQWTVWENVTKNLYKNLSELPLDPKTEQEYTYSLINSNNKYELLSVYESDLLSKNKLINKSFASSNYMRIDWTYNGIFVKTPSYYIPIPSLLTSEDISSTLILDENNIKSQIISGGNNKISIWLIPSKTGELNINLKVYTWTLNIDSEDSDKQDLINIIQEAYTGSSIANKSLYKMILEKTELNDVVNLVDNVILKDTNYVTQTIRNCLAWTIDWITYPSVTYSYSDINSWVNITWTASLNIDGSLKNFSSTITCDNWNVSISNEIAIINDCDSWTISWITFPSVTYSYNNIISWNTIEATASIDNDTINDYSASVTCEDWNVSITNETENKIHWTLASDMSWWSANNTDCHSCLNGYTKRFDQMNLIDCEILASKHKATMLYADSYQHPSTGSDSWRWRIDWNYWVRSPQHSQHYEVWSSSNYYCSLYKWWWSDISNPNWTISQSLDYDNPYLKWEYNWHEYRVYRQNPVSWGNNYYCSVWLRKFGLQMYTMWVQSILQNTSGSLWHPWWNGICSHWLCWSTYWYLSSKTYSDKYSYASDVHRRDWYCYWYTIWK